MDEEKKEEGTQTDTENNADGDSQAAGTTQDSKTETEDTTDYKEQYKRLQADHTQRAQENADLLARIEQLEKPPEEPDDDLDLSGDEEYVDQKTVNKIVDARVEKAVRLIRSQSADAYFRRNYKDLVKHQGVIAGIMRNPTKPPKEGASPEERIDAAVEEFKSLTAEAVEKAKVDAETEAKAKEEAKAKASGLGSTTSTTPTKSDEDVSDAQEIADRKAKSAKKRNLA